ncbi:MAG TPA: phospholipase D family protein [Woeseiaceae bacterium]|nr:phospholipase D family protein [Woeseiaceae bacterium]
MKLVTRVTGFAVLMFAAGCGTLPTDVERTESHTLTGTADTALGSSVAAWADSHEGKSGFFPLPTGLDALGARLALIDRAERSIDTQYFLIKKDEAGLVFCAKLVEAADRGVRVRFLLDDVFTTARDEGLLLLDRHPNIEIRLFNPVARGGIGVVNFLKDFERANRRMHNKSFTVDNEVSIVGGRNIADEYFQLRTDSEFVDFDMLAFGPVAQGVSATFDRYWNHPLSYPISSLKRDAGSYEALREEILAMANTTGRDIYLRSIDTPLVKDLLDRKAMFYAADAEVITDDPDKLLNEISNDQKILVTRLAAVVDRAQSEVIVINPYFIPRDTGLDFWRGVADKGVKVTVLTNSLASTNHVAVHSSYAGYRKRLLEAGVDLYEARANATQVNPETGEKLDTLTLHTKLVAIDRRYLFVGSLNLDPRAIDINTEMGVLIDSAEMVGPMVERFRSRLPGFSYKLEQDEDGGLEWHGLIDGTPVVETSEPLASGWLRFNAWFQKIAPEGQL